VVLFLIVWTVALVIYHMNSAAMARMIATEAILFTHWIHESSENLFRAIETGHAIHSAIF
jgi:hypothetical protein